MICDETFIEFYNETFKFINDACGQDRLEDYWLKINNIVLGDLLALLKEKGLLGAYEYWSKTLNAEGAKFELQFLNDRLTLRMWECPSIKCLKEPYRDYCKHCDVMYRPIFKEAGFKYTIEVLGQGQCRIHIS